MLAGARRTDRGAPTGALVEQLVAGRLGAKRGARPAALVLWWWRAWPQLLALVAVRHEIRAGVEGAVRWLEHELRRIRRGIEWQGAVCGPGGRLWPDVPSDGEPAVAQVAVRAEQLEAPRAEAKVLYDLVQMRRLALQRDRHARRGALAGPQDDVGIDIAVHEERVGAAHDRAADAHEAVLHDRRQQRRRGGRVLRARLGLRPHDVFAPAEAPALQAVAPALEAVVAAVADPQKHEALTGREAGYRQLRHLVPCPARVPRLVRRAPCI